MKSLDELINRDDSALPMVLGWTTALPGRCDVLPPAEDSGDALVRTQVTTRSPMGAVIYHTGGLLIEGGWLRVLGSGHPQLTRSFPSWNEGRSEGFLLIADDAVGGFFAVNGGAFQGDRGSVFYWAPDALEWADLRIGYSGFLQWSLTTDFRGFYDDLRWPGWEAEVAALPGDRCIAFYPFLWTSEGSARTSYRSTVPVAEAYTFKCETLRQLSAG